SNRCLRLLLNLRAQRQRQKQRRPTNNESHGGLLTPDRVNLGDIAARELDHCCLPVADGIWFDQYGPSCRPCFVERLAEIGDFVSGQFAPVRIRQMPVGDENGEHAELRCDSNSPDRIGPSPDLYTWCMRIVAQNLTVRKLEKA